MRQTASARKKKMMGIAAPGDDNRELPRGS
jgi:hypothetical protein